MSIATTSAWRAVTSAPLLMLSAACGEPRPAAEPEADVTMAYAEVPEPAPIGSTAARPLCSGLSNAGYTRLSNGGGHGSPYFSMLSRCSDDVRLNVDFYTETDALFGFQSDHCPGERVSGNVPPKRASESNELYTGAVRKFLADRLAAFRNECRLGRTTARGIFDGFRETYIAEMEASWIHNRYIDKLAVRNRLGWADAELAKEARREYEQTH